MSEVNRDIRVLEHIMRISAAWRIDGDKGASPLANRRQ